MTIIIITLDPEKLCYVSFLFRTSCCEDHFLLPLLNEMSFLVKQKQSFVCVSVCVCVCLCVPKDEVVLAGASQVAGWLGN